MENENHFIALKVEYKKLMINYLKTKDPEFLKQALILHNKILLKERN